MPRFATVKGDPQDYLARLTRFVATQNITLEYDAGIGPAHGMSSGSKITLLPDLAPAEHLATLAHEVGHELLVRGERRSQTTHTIRETEAEAVAFVVCSAIGLDVNTASSDYVLLHGGDKATLAESVECPTGSGNYMTLFEVAKEIGRRNASMFLRDANGQRPVYGGTRKFQDDPHWKDYILYYEYFHGENGAGLGASHQTSWTGLVARELDIFARIKAEELLIAPKGEIAAKMTRQQVAGE